MENSKYPHKDGWINAKLQIKPGTQFSQEDVVKFCTVGDPDLYEVAEFKHFNTVIRMTFRKHKLSDKQFNNVAHALGIEMNAKKLPKDFYRNRYVTSSNIHFDELVKKGFATRSQPIPMYDNDRVYTVTELGQKVFRSNFESWIKLRKKIQA